MKEYSGGNVVRLKGGRAEARGASARVQATALHDKLIRRINRKPLRPRLPDEHLLNEQIDQATEAVAAWPYSIPAQKRLAQLITVYNYFYGG
jgi:hypothetical protein